MSKKQYVSVECPGCGAGQMAAVWKSINVTLDAELKEKLLQGQINTFTCSACGDPAFLDVPLLYQDMKKKFCVQYFPPEYLNDASAFEEFNAKGKLALGRIEARLPDDLNAYMEEPHVVFSMNEMARYVLFRDILHQKAQSDPGI